MSGFLNVGVTRIDHFYAFFLNFSLIFCLLILKSVTCCSWSRLVFLCLKDIPKSYSWVNVYKVFVILRHVHVFTDFDWFGICDVNEAANSLSAFRHSQCCRDGDYRDSGTDRVGPLSCSLPLQPGSLVCSSMSFT